VATQERRVAAGETVANAATRALIVIDDSKLTQPAQELVLRIAVEGRALGLTLVVCVEARTDVPPALRRAATAFVYMRAVDAAAAVARGEPTARVAVRA
jgi:hypothetical protein